MTVEHRPLPPWARRQEIRVGAVIAVALAIGFVVWLVAIRGGGSSKAKVTTIAPTAATAERMHAVAKDVGTYPVPDAYKVLNALARKGGESSFPAPRGGFAVYAKASPTNIYVAYPDLKDVQIEVYDPSPKRARSLIDSGRIAPVP